MDVRGREAGEVVEVRWERVVGLKGIGRRGECFGREGRGREGRLDGGWMGRSIGNLLFFRQAVEGNRERMGGGKKGTSICEAILEG